MHQVQIGDLVTGNDRPLTLIAGPCQLESADHAQMIAGLRGVEVAGLLKRDEVLFTDRTACKYAYIVYDHHLEERRTKSLAWCEEVGIEVAKVRYFGSQPWPFPDSLMMAFTAEYARGEIRIDENEILRAAWFAPDAMPPRIGSGGAPSPRHADIAGSRRVDGVVNGSPNSIVRR